MKNPGRQWLKLVDKRRYQDASNTPVRLATIPQYLRIPVVPYTTSRFGLTLNTANTDEPLTYFCQGFPIEGR